VLEKDSAMYKVSRLRMNAPRLVRVLAIFAMMATSLPALCQGSTISADAQVVSPSGQLYLVDPYLYLKVTNASSPIDTSSLITAIQTNYPAIQALGMVTDGTATVIAVYQSQANLPIYFSYNSNSTGVTFAPWSESFLSASSPPGALSGPVTPVPQNGNYYSIALVQAPPQSALSGTGAYQSVLTAGPTTATTGGTATLLLAPTPVVFVHGLWGDKNSLSETESALAVLGPWAGNSASNGYTFGGYNLAAICYSKFLAFNAPIDPYTQQSGMDPVCEVTSQTALETYFAHLDAALDTAQFVGGRVDFVGHSMGGLVARYYSSLTEYNSNRTFGQGLFRTVVTIDTPEEGSALATDLLNNEAQRTCGNETTPTSSNLCAAATGETFSAQIFSDLCGARGTTLADCFAGPILNNPLGPPGSSNFVGGAVWSLEPGCGSITSLPSPNIPFSKWVAINSDYSDSAITACSQPSLLRVILNGLVASTYSSTPPNLSGILNNTENDVIVTLPSQTDFPNATPAVTYSFPSSAQPSACLAHAPIPYSDLLAFLMNDSNASVTTSPAVDGAVACALTPTIPQCSSGSSIASMAEMQSPKMSGSEAQNNSQSAGNIAQNSQPPVSKEESDARIAELLKHRRQVTPERIKVSTPSLEVPLGSPFEATVAVAPGELFSPIMLSQQGKWERSGGVAKIVREEGNARIVEVVPVELGAVDVRVSVLYKDNALAAQTLHLNVVPSAKGLKKFRLGVGKELDLVLEAAGRQTPLQPEVSYEGIASNIYLHGIDQITVTVDQPEDNPVVRVDANGWVHGLRPGTAIIAADFAGVKDQVTVNVYTKENAPMNYRQIHPLPK
jgi:pimeloyl-ACP methyl ester carboxylesterase